MRKFPSIVLMFFLISSTMVCAAGFDITVDESKLNNGLTVLIAPDSTAVTVSVFTFVNAGSRDEDRAGVTGLAHVFEHMMFRGTEKYPVFSDAVSPLGAETNAWTTNDYTAYFLNAESRFLDKMLDIESDRIRNLIFTNETFRTELGPVKEERRRGVVDDPEGFLSVELERLAYTIHTYHHPVIGWEEDLEQNMTSDDGLQFKNRHYVPNNCVLVISGNVAVDEARKAVEKYYGDWKPGEAYTSLVLPEPKQTEERVKNFTWKDDETSPLMRIAFHIPSANQDFESLAAMNLINEVLFSNSGRLTRQLQNDLTLVESISGDGEMRKDPSLAVISARLRKGASLAEVRDSVYSELRRISTTVISDEELDRARNNLRARMIYGLNSPSRIASSLGVNRVITGNYRALMQLFELYASVSPEKIRILASEVFIPTNRTVVTLVPKSGI